MSWRARHDLVEGLRETFPSGSPVPGTMAGEFVGVRADRDEAVLIIRWAKDPQLYGIPIDLTDTRPNYSISDVATVEDWLDSVGMDLMESLDTGLRARARRRRVGDYIELRLEPGWPTDHRFYVTDADPALPGLPVVLRRAGLDPSPALDLAALGVTISWLVSYENNATGHPYVGQALIVATGPDTAELIQVQTTPGMPATVRLNVAYFAAHAAAVKGARTITTSLTDPVLDLAGFRSAGDSRRLTTTFLDADHDAAGELLEVSRATDHRWGSDRDLSGRHLPTGRARRALHRLRHGRPGQPAARDHRAG